MESRRIYCHNNTFVEKKQEVLYNTELRRWEYYGANTVIRAGEPQPNFVSQDYEKCMAYKKTTERG